jgi:hypothetical protein
MTKPLPKHVLVKNQTAFTLTVEIDQKTARAIQRALNQQAKEFGIPLDEWMSAEQFIKNDVVYASEELVCDLVPYDR